MKIPAVGRFSLFLLLVLTAVPAIWLGGCSARRPSPSESSPGDLLVLGRENMADRDFERAREAFNKILQEYPESNLRSEALLSLADSFYASRELQEAKFQYEKFVQLYPVNPQTPRALYYLAMSDYRRMLSLDRDQTETENALQNFKRLVRQYPNSTLVVDAKPKIEELETRLAAKQLYIGRFYYNNSDYQSSIPRLRNLVQKYPNTPAVPEALFYLADSYAREENIGQARETLQQLLQKYPKSAYRNKAERLLNKLPKVTKTSSAPR